MQIERMAYIVDYYGKEVPKRLKKMDINLAYISKRFNYAVVYFDKDKGESLLISQLKKVRGFNRVYSSLYFNEEANI